MLKVTVTQMVGWEWAKRLLLKTIGKRPSTPLPTKEQKLEWLISEHSPIKVVEWCIDMDELRQWVGVHLLRHDYVLPYICSQRSDKVSNPDEVAEQVLSIIKDDIVNDPDFDRSKWRDWRIQGSENDHAFVVNAQTLINISRKRLCRAASKETLEAWKLVHEAIKEQDPEMANAMVPNCIYRGFCTEKKCCGYVLSEKYAQELKAYRSLIPPATERLKK